MLWDVQWSHEAFGLWPDVTDYRSRYEAGCGHLAIEFPMEKV